MPLLPSPLPIQVSGLVDRTPDDRFPFGYAALEPLLNITKSTIVMFVSLAALLSSINAIMAGGNQKLAGVEAVVYAVISVVLCLLACSVQLRLAKFTGSSLLWLDAKNWSVIFHFCFFVF